MMKLEMILKLGMGMKKLDFHQQGYGLQMNIKLRPSLKTITDS